MKLNNMTIPQLLQHYRDGDFTPRELIEALLERAQAAADAHTWIHLMSLQEIMPFLDRLASHSPDDLPLYGIPFAIKDNIDLAGIPTTAACPAYSYMPEQSAYIVARLLEAGAIPLGKTNLDQFATGLVGTRSPYGATVNPFNDAYIAGGSSSGSAVAVAQGLVSFALGTDTAGSGRVPAAFNNILGLKPSRGLLSNQGVVPACKSLDCVALFATTAGDLQMLFDLLAVYDPADAYARQNPSANSTHKATPQHFSFAIPQDAQLEFFGNHEYQRLFQQTVQQLEKLGGEKHTIDFAPFLQAARLLYEGPWVTERYLACQPLIDEQPDDMLEVTRSIIAPGKANTASDTFNAFYKLQVCKQQADALFAPYDFLLTPTAGTIYTIEEINNDPVKLNANLGYYTNYMNLLDYAAVAVPAGMTRDNLPFGVTLVSKAFHDQALLAFAQHLQQALGLPLGATSWALPSQRDEAQTESDTLDIVVCGAHLSGLPLNHQLVSRGATLIRQCKSAPHYKLYALAGGPPLRPGMIRVEQDGTAIEVEVWRVPLEHVGSFLAGIPHPLGLGKVELEDGSQATGFICEAYVSQAATDISEFGGWRAFLAAR